MGKMNWEADTGGEATDGDAAVRVAASRSMESARSLMSGNSMSDDSQWGMCVGQMKSGHRLAGLVSISMEQAL